MSEVEPKLQRIRAIMGRERYPFKNNKTQLFELVDTRFGFDCLAGSPGYWKYYDRYVVNDSFIGVRG